MKGSIRDSRSRGAGRAIQVALAVALALAVTALAAGCGGDEKFATSTYPFTFEYPSGWKATRNAAFVYGAGAGERSVAVQFKAPDDQVVVTQYKLQKTLPPGIVANQKEVDRIVRKLAKQSGGTATDARAVKYGGLPGYQYVIEYTTGGKQLRNTITFLFSGNDEFQVNCQSSTENRDVVDEGCDKVLSTLKFE